MLFQFGWPSPNFFPVITLLHVGRAGSKTLPAHPHPIRFVTIFYGTQHSCMTLDHVSPILCYGHATILASPTCSFNDTMYRWMYECQTVQYDMYFWTPMFKICIDGKKRGGKQNTILHVFFGLSNFVTFSPCFFPRCNSVNILKHIGECGKWYILA